MCVGISAERLLAARLTLSDARWQLTVENGHLELLSLAREQRKLVGRKSLARPLGENTFSKKKEELDGQPMVIITRDTSLGEVYSKTSTKMALTNPPRERQHGAVI